MKTLSTGFLLGSLALIAIITIPLFHYFEWLEILVSSVAYAVMATLSIAIISFAIIAGSFAGLAINKAQASFANRRLATFELQNQANLQNVQVMETMARIENNTLALTAFIASPQFTTFKNPDLQIERPAPLALQSGQMQLEAPQISRLPDKVLLPDVLQSPNLNNIVLGVGADGVISAPLSSLVHVAVGGSSGWGKSVFLRSLAYQIALAPQNAELALIDLEAATFSPFANSAKLRYQIADTENDANAVLVDLIGELNRRKGLFKAHPTVESLEAYNLLADNPLPFIALMIDESTALLSDKTIEANIRALALRARKYGIYAVLGGQDWKASSLDSAIKNQLSTKIQLKAQSKAQSRVLLDNSIAAEINQKGRAYAILPGDELTEIQTPYISLPMLMKALADVGVNNSPPKVPVVEGIQPPTEQEQSILNLHQNGASVSAIATEVFGAKGGNQVARVKGILEKYGQ